MNKRLLYKLIHETEQGETSNSIVARSVARTIVENEEAMEMFAGLTVPYQPATSRQQAMKNAVFSCGLAHLSVEIAKLVAEMGED